MLATDMQPASIVEDKGFQKFVAALDSRYELPSRRTIMQSLLPDKYEETKKMVMSNLAAASHVALTTDIWSSRQTQGFLTVTAHYITTSWEMGSAVLETIHLSCDHTGENIAAELQRIAHKWEIADKIICLITDNASNMAVAARITGWRHLPCFAHTLNLVVKDALKADEEIMRIQHKTKEIVTFFHHCVKASDKL